MAEKPGWDVFSVGTDDGVLLEVHVAPQADVVAHELDEGGCVCGPDQQLCRNQDDGPDVWMYVHHSLDGREASE